MCGIFAHLNFGELKERNSVDVCMEGLRQLEYRGYDSAGIAGIKDGQICSIKSVGKVSTLDEAVKPQQLQFRLAIAHTRWATHGRACEANAHPQFDQDHRLALVHNGIIENYAKIKQTLVKKGVTFSSETDTETIAQLFAHHYKENLLKAAVNTFSELDGAFSVALIHKDHPDQIVVSSRDAPLVIGINDQTNEIFVSSDTNAFTGQSLRVLFLKKDEIALLSPDGIELYNKKGKALDITFEELCVEECQTATGEFDHYMLKEIYDQPLVLKEIIHSQSDETNHSALFEQLVLTPKQIKNVDQILIVACGSSLHAGYLAANMIETAARIPTRAEIASEFRYSDPIITKNTLVIAISQSGETADTLAACELAIDRGAHLVAICNVKHSTLVRMAPSTILLNAGPEISVCSTKAFTSQVCVLQLLTLYLARIRTFGASEGREFLRKCEAIPHLAQEVLKRAGSIASLAEKYARFTKFFYLGRQQMYPTCLEAALKLKEITYLQASGLPAGEMKHGAIALIDESLATIALCGNHVTNDKLFSNLMEIKARGGPILAFAPDGSESLQQVADDVLYLPIGESDEQNIYIYSIATQLFAYYVAKNLGTNIDQPRNLAKSVTVE
ncbi:MAG: Glutamine--fructose-6-phosphate aminotransferase [isomerizing] [Chlamydiia bacterium]|nr:Glutamine--fructose-6-phosphate aminotransferase [isomerizing] [Chlamydiia bacterium]